ncbi:MAG: hypothetical protein Q9212_003656 [Teloschistes hypoglaucus]
MAICQPGSSYALREHSHGERNLQEHKRRQLSRPSRMFSSSARTPISQTTAKQAGNTPKRKNTTQANMQLQTLLPAIAAILIGISPALALPEPVANAEPVAIPELLANRAVCLGGHHDLGSSCLPTNKGKLSCSTNDKIVVSHHPLFWHLLSPLWAPLRRCECADG